MDAVLRKFFTQAVGTMFSASKDQYLAPVSIFDQLRENRSLTVLITTVGSLNDRLSSWLLRGDLYGKRLV